MDAPTQVWPGRPNPLGATWDGKGVNFALFSAHGEAVDLCLFDAGGARETARLRIQSRTDGVWHGYLPGARPDLLYGYRVHGPYAPQEGHRFNPNKLLIDPYARALHGSLRLDDVHFGYELGSPRADLSFDRRDDAAFVPKARVVDGAFDWGQDRRPGVPWGETAIYELHLRGMTMRHPAVPPGRRGTCAGLASPPVIDYLRGLGVTTVELMPVHAFVDDYRLVRNGLVNYWGYNSLGFFAPERRYLASRDVAEFKTMVKALHAAGIEVLLDVVYNHTGETDHLGPTLSFRGIDNRSYYRLEADRRFYVNHAGTGNVLDFDHPRVRQLVLDSLRYWTEEMHVDGFRFDLCPVLARVKGVFRPDAPFLAAVAADPVLSRLKLVAEPWDVGPDGFRLGGFPPGWAEWNSRYRDAVRRFWRGDAGLIGELATRLAGSADLFERSGRRPWSSVNFVAVHDGFTLHDVVSYERKHNEANLEGNRDGTDENFAWNCGVEGPTDDPAVTALRDRQKRNFLATLLLSLGTPMLQMGDERGRSQRGNNNAYCQDGPAVWVDWEGLRPADEALRRLVERLVALRRRHPAFARRSFFRGAATPAGVKDITWLLPEGREPRPSDWGDRARRCLGYLLAGASESRAGRAESLLVLMNADRADLAFRLSPLPAGSAWEVLLDTATVGDQSTARRLFSAGEAFPLKAHSLALLVGPAGAEPRRSGRIQ